MFEQKRQKCLWIPLTDEWYVTKEGEDVTDDFIRGAPGYRKRNLGEKMGEVQSLKVIKFLLFMAMIKR